jgi:hypothetical protein
VYFFVKGKGEEVQEEEEKKERTRRRGNIKSERRLM